MHMPKMTLGSAPKKANVFRNRQMRFVAAALAPIAVYYLLFSVYPVFSALWISFHNWHLMERVHAFAGLGNYAKIFTDHNFLVIVRNTLYFALLNVTGNIALGLLLAIFVNSLHKRLALLMRSVIFIPVVTSMVAVSMMFSWIYQPSLGILNYLFSRIGLGPFKFLTSSAEVMPSIVFMTIWKNIGYTMVIFIAGLTTISRDMYEAAEVDGANTVDRFCRITLPLLKPTTMFVTITSVISSLQVFTQIYNTTKGGPGTASRTIVMHIYETAFKFFQMGEASALAFFLFVVIMCVTLVEIRAMRSETYY
jgi:multiple sugar transport system permease protein